MLSFSFSLLRLTASPLDSSSCLTVPDSLATRRGTVSRWPSAETSVTREGEEVDGVDIDALRINDASFLDKSEEI